MDCRRVLYFIKLPQYTEGKGWTTEAAKEAFDKDICSLFAKDGWTIAAPGSSGACYTATTSDGDGELYLHPIMIAGYVKKGSILHIEEVLRNGATFRYEGKRVTGIVYDKNLVESEKPKDEERKSKFNIVTKAGVFDVREAESAEDALCDFAATMDLDMHQYFEAMPVTEESTGEERAASKYADADRHGAETGQETE